MAQQLIDIANRLRAYKESVYDLLTVVIDENASLIEDINISQLQNGERADGTTLPDYSHVSVSKYGKPPGPIKLFDTGAFYRGITTKIFTDRFEMIGTDSKTNMLQKTYGKDITGISDSNLVVIQDTIVNPGMIEKTHKFLTNEQL